MFSRWDWGQAIRRLSLLGGPSCLVADEELGLGAGNPQVVAHVGAAEVVVQWPLPSVFQVGSDGLPPTHAPLTAAEVAPEVPHGSASTAITAASTARRSAGGIAR